MKGENRFSKVKEIVIHRGNNEKTKLKVTAVLNVDEFQVECDRCGSEYALFDTRGKLYCSNCPYLELFL